MRSQEVDIKHSSSPFSYKLSFCVVDTPKGKIRTLTIIDQEVVMTDKEPHNEMTMCINDKSIKGFNDFGRNKDELKKFCKFVLKELK